MLNAHFVECTHLRNVALSSWLSSSFLCNEFAQCSFLIGDVNCSTSGTFATLYSAAWVFRYKFWLLSPWTGFRKLHGYGFHKNFGEDRGSWLGKKVLFSQTATCRDFSLLHSFEWGQEFFPMGPAYLLNACCASLSNCFTCSPILIPLIW